MAALWYGSTRAGGAYTNSRGFGLRVASVAVEPDGGIIDDVGGIDTLLALSSSLASRLLLAVSLICRRLVRLLIPS